MLESDSITLKCRTLNVQLLVCASTAETVCRLNCRGLTNSPRVAVHLVLVLSGSCLSWLFMSHRAIGFAFLNVQ